MSVNKWLRRVLKRSREVEVKRGRGRQVINVEEPPSETLLWILKMLLGFFATFGVLQGVHMVAFKTYNTDIHNAMMYVVAALIGLIAGNKA